MTIALLIVVCLIAGGLLDRLVSYVTRERHPVTREDGERALKDMTMYYRDVRRRKP
jgi:hypothetical protein